MTSTAKAHEPTMEEILASIRRIIADDDPASAQPPSQPAKAKPETAAAAKPKLVEDPAPAAEADAGGLNQDDIDAMLASFDAPEAKTAAAPAPAKDEEDDLAAAWADATDLKEDEEPEAAPQSVDAEEDVLELTEFAAVPKPDEDFDDVAFAPEPPSRAEPVAPLTSAARAARAEFPLPGSPSARPQASVESLIAQETGDAVSAAFGSLNNTILSQNARTLDDLVQEMLRPMLKDWLDENLPQIVERLVRAEIERVSRGRR